MVTENGAGLMRILGSIVIGGGGTSGGWDELVAEVSGLLTPGTLMPIRVRCSLTAGRIEPVAALVVLRDMGSK
jgi:hypothetical protein